MITKITLATLSSSECEIREIVRKGMDSPKTFVNRRTAITIPMMTHRNLPTPEFLSWVGFTDNELTNQYRRKIIQHVRIIYCAAIIRIISPSGAERLDRS
jgi:hypothetical protein